MSPHPANLSPPLLFFYLQHNQPHFLNGEGPWTDISLPGQFTKDTLEDFVKLPEETLSQLKPFDMFEGKLVLSVQKLQVNKDRENRKLVIQNIYEWDHNNRLLRGFSFFYPADTHHLPAEDLIPILESGISTFTGGNPLDPSQIQLIGTQEKPNFQPKYFSDELRYANQLKEIEGPEIPERWEVIAAKVANQAMLGRVIGGIPMPHKALADPYYLNNFADPAGEEASLPEAYQQEIVTPIKRSQDNWQIMHAQGNSDNFMIMSYALTSPLKLKYQKKEKCYVIPPSQSLQVKGTLSDAKEVNIQNPKLSGPHNYKLHPRQKGNQGYALEKEIILNVSGSKPPNHPQLELPPQFQVVVPKGSMVHLDRPPQTKKNKKSSREPWSGPTPDKKGFTLNPKIGAGILATVALVILVVFLVSQNNKSQESATTQDTASQTRVQPKKITYREAEKYYLKLIGNLNVSHQKSELHEYIDSLNKGPKSKESQAILAKLIDFDNTYYANALKKSNWTRMVHQVKNGPDQKSIESIEKIASTYEVSLEDIWRANKDKFEYKYQLKPGVDSLVIYRGKSK